MPLTIRSTPQTRKPRAIVPGNRPGPYCWPGIFGNDCTWNSTTMPSSASTAPMIASLIFTGAGSTGGARGRRARGAEERPPPRSTQSQAARPSSSGTPAAQRATGPLASLRQAGGLHDDAHVGVALRHERREVGLLRPLRAVTFRRREFLEL